MVVVRSMQRSCPVWVGFPLPPLPSSPSLAPLAQKMSYNILFPFNYLYIISLDLSLIMRRKSEQCKIVKHHNIMILMLHKCQHLKRLKIRVENCSRFKETKRGITTKYPWSLIGWSQIILLKYITGTDREIWMTVY